MPEDVDAWALTRLVAKNIATVRKARGWTVEELAAGAGLTAPDILRIESGTEHIWLTEHGDIAEAFDLDPTLLMQNIEVTAKGEVVVIEAPSSAAGVRRSVTAIN